MHIVYNSLILVCVVFTLYFIFVVCADAETMQRKDIKNGVKYDLPLWKIVWRYLKKSFRYHFPSL